MRTPIILLFAFILSGALSTQKKVELEWWVEYKKDTASFELFKAPATVPGAVQLDIASAEGYGPYYYADNWQDYLWMEDHEFVYLTNFIKPRMAPGERLVFRSLGIDYEFEIIFNGQKLLHQEGMFTPVRLDLTSRLSINNELKIRIFPVPKKHSEPVDRSQAAASVKPAVSYGWDWHPRLVPLGIWDDTFLEIKFDAHIEELDF